MEAYKTELEKQYLAKLAEKRKNQENIENQGMIYSFNFKKFFIFKLTSLWINYKFKRKNDNNITKRNTEAIKK